MDNTSLATDLLKVLSTQLKRYFIIILVLIIALVSTNAYWIWDSSQWEYETESVDCTVDTQNNGGNAIINTGEGDVDYGEGKLQTKNKEKETQKKMIETNE